jgi:hypothetical protein
MISTNLDFGHMAFEIAGIVLAVAACIIASRLTKIHKVLEGISKKLGQNQP